MNCSMFLESMEALLDNEVEATERGGLEAHAAACENCRKQMVLSRKTREAMKTFTAPQAPTGFAPRVASAAKPATISIFSRSRWKAAAAAVFVLAGASLGAYMLLSAGSVKDPLESPIAQETPKPVPIEETPLVRESIEVAQAPAANPQIPAEPAASARVASAANEDEGIAENLEILENWELLNDPDVAIALALPDEDFEVLMSALEEGM